jgi:hypothetical protein
MGLSAGRYAARSLATSCTVPVWNLGMVWVWHSTAVGTKPMYLWEPTSCCMAQQVGRTVTWVLTPFV